MTKHKKLISPTVVDWRDIALRALHDLTMYNMARKGNANIATCICCGRVTHLINKRYPFKTTDSRRTAICECFVDAVIFSKDPLPQEVLDALHKKYFKNPHPVRGESYE